MKTLIVIDMQNDFIDGSLGSFDAQKIVPTVKAKIQEYLKNGDRVIFTRDTHGEDYLNTHEGGLLPVTHCVKNTRGWQIADGLYAEGCQIIDKPTFGYTGWSGLETDEIELIGLCTDICVVSNAIILRALFENADISVDASCCAGTSKESHEAALRTMACCQIKVVNG